MFCDVWFALYCLVVLLYLCVDVGLHLLVYGMLICSVLSLRLTLLVVLRSPLVVLCLLRCVWFVYIVVLFCFVVVCCV